MSKKTTSMLKGIGIGLLLCVMVMEGCKMIASMNNPKNRRKRYRLKQDTGRAMRVVGDIIEDVECMFAKR